MFYWFLIWLCWALRDLGLSQPRVKRPTRHLSMTPVVPRRVFCGRWPTGDT